MKIDKERMRKLKASLANIALFLSIFSGMALVLITMSAPNASADTLIVPSAEYPTIASAIAGANPLGGDTILVYAGLYNESITINKPLTLQGNHSSNTTIQPPPGSPGTVITISASWVNVTGFRIKNGSGGVWSGGISIGSQTHTNISYNIVEDNNANGIFINGGSNNEIYNNQINSNGQKGVYIYGSSNNTIRANNISNHVGGNWVYSGGVYLDGYPYAPSSWSTWNTIDFNTFTSNTNGIFHYRNTNNNTMDNNEIYDSTKRGVSIGHHNNKYSNKNNDITNNIINNSQGEGGVYIYYAPNNEITHNTMTNCTNGILLINSNDNIIGNNNVLNNTNYGIYLNGSLGSHNNTISNNNVSNNGKTGIYLNGSSGSHYNTISNNTASNNGYHGISLNGTSGSHYNNVSNNIVIKNGRHGILLYKSNNCTVTWNYIASNSKHGIRVFFSDQTPCTWSDVIDDNTTIENNTILNNSWSGIYIDYIHNSSISWNNVSNNKNYGIEIWNESHNNSINNNQIHSNALNGISLTYLCLNNSINQNIVDSNEIGILIKGNSNGALVSGNYINNSLMGLKLDNIYNNTYWGNKITNNESSEYGIYIIGDYRNYIARNNTVDGEEVYYYYNSNNGTKADPTKVENIANLATPKVINLGKISVIESSFINFNNKTISNAPYGIFLYNSNNISLDNNSITNVDEHGLHVEGNYRHNITTDNIVEGEPIYYYYNLTGSEGNLIPVSNLNLNQLKVSNVGKITIVDSNYFLLKDNIVSNNDYGIFLYGSKEITMWNNMMATPILAGLFIEDGFHHNISQNNTANNQIIYYFTDIQGSEGSPKVNDTFIINSQKVSNVGLITYVNCSYMEIRNNSLQSNYGSGIFIVDSFNIMIKNNIASGNCDGMVLRSSMNVTVTENKFNSNTKNPGYGKRSGIHLKYTGEESVNYIIDNTEVKSNSYGIYVDYSKNDVIAYHDQTIADNGRAIYLDHSSPHIHNNSIKNVVVIDAYYSHPIIDGNSFYGPPGGIGIYHLSYCNNSAKIINNTFEDFGLASIYLMDSSSPDIIDNVIKNTKYDGIDVYHGDSAPYIYNNTIYNNQSNLGYVGIQLEDANATIINNRIFNMSEGINVNLNPHVKTCELPYYGSNATIIGNRIWNCSRTPPPLRGVTPSTRNAGIDFVGYSIGVIKNNIIYNCSSLSTSKGFGIYVESASPSEISGNNCSSNDYGMKIIGLNPDLRITNNSVINNTYEGIIIEGAANTLVVERNNVSFNNLGFNIFSGSQCQIKNNRVLFNEYGLYIISGSPTISHNFIENNNNGTRIQGSASAIINNNCINWSVYYGIYIDGASNNLIYHNNFFNNTNQAYDNTNDSNQWDNGYPSGGNYWSDFDDSSEGAYDDYQGAEQNVSGSDGIVDNGTVGGGGKNPYVIDADSQDDYPLINPWGMVHNVDKDLWYFTIQSAVNDADSGNTLEAMMGTYEENVVVDKTVNITGKYGSINTIIDGGGSGDVVRITADWVNLTGFTVTNSGSDTGDAGIELDNANNCIISNNKVSSNSQGILFSSSTGIYITQSSNVIIEDNTISDSNIGVHILDSSDITIENSSIIENDIGVQLHNSSSIIQYNNISYNTDDGIGDINHSNAIIRNNIITYNNQSGISNILYSNGTIDNNTISNNTYGIHCGLYSSPIITYNNITSNSIGILSADGSNATIHWNNIHNNTIYNASNLDSSVILNAIYNYWGAPTPNPNGINGNVTYDPWLLDPVEEAGPQ